MPMGPENQQLRVGVAAGGISHDRHDNSNATQRLSPSWWPATWRKVDRQTGGFQHHHLIWSFVVCWGLGLIAAILVQVQASGWQPLRKVSKPRWRKHPRTAKRGGWTGIFPAEIAPLATANSTR